MDLLNLWETECCLTPRTKEVRKAGAEKAAAEEANKGAQVAQAIKADVTDTRQLRPAIIPQLCPSSAALPPGTPRYAPGQ